MKFPAEADHWCFGAGELIRQSIRKGDADHLDI